MHAYVYFMTVLTLYWRNCLEEIDFNSSNLETLKFDGYES